MGQLAIIIKDFFIALSTMRRSAAKYILYTGLIGIALVALMLWIIWSFSSWFGTLVVTWIPWDWAKQTVFFSMISGIALAWICWITLKYILLIVSGPMLSIVSEKLEKKLGGDSGIKGFSFATSAARSVRINLRNLTKELVFSIVLLISGLIPGFNMIAIVLLFIIQAYFAGFGIMDYYLERHYTYKESLALVYKHKWAAIGLGAIFTFLFLIPIIGVMFAPYLCTVAATHYFVNQGIGKQEITY